MFTDEFSVVMDVGLWFKEFKLSLYHKAVAYKLFPPAITEDETYVVTGWIKPGQNSNLAHWRKRVATIRTQELIIFDIKAAELEDKEEGVVLVVDIFHTNPISLLARPDDVRKAVLDIAWANLTRPVSRVTWLFIW